MTEDLHIQQDNLSIPIQEAKGYFRKYELIGRPPKTLIFQLQRKLALYGLSYEYKVDGILYCPNRMILLIFHRF